VLKSNKLEKTKNCGKFISQVQQLYKH